MADADARTDPDLNAAAKAGGFTFLTISGLTIIKEFHVLDQGVVNLDSLFHMQLPPGAPTVKVSEGGVALNCDQDWMIGPFAVASPILLDAGGADARGPAGDGAALAAKVASVAAKIAKAAPAGDILLIGSGDDRQSRARNVELAQQRADNVGGLLNDALHTLQPQATRQILYGNKALSYMKSGVQANDLVATDGLARLLYGPGEASSRSVQLCVLMPQARGVTVGENPYPANFWQGTMIGGGATIGILIAASGVLFAAYWGVRLVRRLTPSGKDASHADAEPE